MANKKENAIKLAVTRHVSGSPRPNVIGGEEREWSANFRVTRRSQNIFGSRTRPFLWRYGRVKRSVAQTGAVGVIDITPGPLEENENPISELNNEKQVDEQPAKPGEKPAQLDYFKIGDCFVSADRGHAPFVPILERFRGTPKGSSKNVASRVFSRLHREWGNSRKRFSALMRKIGNIPDGKNLRMPRNT